MPTDSNSVSRNLSPCSSSAFNQSDTKCAKDNNTYQAKNGILLKQSTVSFDCSEPSRSNNSSIRNNLLWSHTSTNGGSSRHLKFPASSSTLTPLMSDDRCLRKSSTRSMFDLHSRCVFVRQTSTTSNCAPSLTSSIMQALSTSINTAAATTTIVVGKPLYESYPQRWFVLATICLLALSNATQWMSFVSLPNAAVTFYCMKTNGNFSNFTNTAAINLPEHMPQWVGDCDVLYWLSQIFQIVGVLTGIVGMYITDRFGIRVSVYCGSIFNFGGAVIRVASSLPMVATENRLSLLYFGQTIAAISQPFFLCLSPKVAEYWFSEHQRTLANALSFIANPLGVVIGSAVPVIFVSNTSNNSNDILWLNFAVLLLAATVVLMAMGIQSSRPPTPPSASSDCNNTPLFFEGLFMLFKKPIFYVQMITFGMAFAIQWSFFITAENMLSKLNYVDKITAYLVSLSALCGCVSSLLFGYLVDRSKKFKEAINICYVGLSVVATLLDIFVRRSRTTDWDILFLIIFLMALGFFSIPVFPLSLELGVETTFPVAEATSSGILCISGQLLMFVITYGMSSFEKLNWIYVIKQDHKNYQLSIDFWTISTIAATSFSFFFLRPR